MSLTTDARTYADSAVAQSRSALAHAGTALGQAGIALGAVNRRLLADAPKPVYAALGAADLVAASVTKRAEELPADAAHSITKAQQTGKALLGRAQSEATTRLDDLRGRIALGRQTAATLPGTARDAGEGYLTTAKSAGEAYLQAAKGLYASLTDRGAARAAELRKNPRVAKLIGQAGETVGDVRDSVVDVRDSVVDVRDTVAPLAKSAFDAVTEPTVAEPTVAELKPAKSTSTRRPAGARTAATKAKKTTARKSSDGKA